MYPSIVAGKKTYVLQNHLNKQVGLLYCNVMKQNEYISVQKYFNIMFNMKKKY